MGTLVTINPDLWPSGTKIVAGAYNSGTPGTLGFGTVSKQGGVIDTDQSITVDSAFGRVGNGIKISQTTNSTAAIARATSTASGGIITPDYIQSMSFVLVAPAAAPAQALNLLGPRDTGGKGTLQWSPSGKLVWRDISATPVSYDVAVAGTVALGSMFRVTIIAQVNPTTPAAGSLAIKGYSVVTGAPIAGINFSRSDVNLGSAMISAFDFGGAQGAGYPATFGFDEIQIENGRTTEIPDFAASTPLAKPTVTKGATTQPTAHGAADGKQRVSWPAVPNAVAYDAFIAQNNLPTPADGDFVLFATGVTSPYDFIGLDGGDYAYGIQAR